MQQNFILLKTFGIVKKSKTIKVVKNMIVWKADKVINSPQITHDSNLKKIKKANGR